ncbi:MAG: hypothetical protein ACOC3G_03545 [Phycisphaeraceae bacterium]
MTMLLPQTCRAAACAAALLALACPFSAFAQNDPPPPPSPPAAEAAEAADASEDEVKPDEGPKHNATGAQPDAAEGGATDADATDADPNAGPTAEPEPAAEPEPTIVSEPLDEVDRVLRSLASPSYEQRVAATQRLMDTDFADTPRLEKALAASDSVEVQHRLMRVMRHRAVMAMRDDVDNPEGGSLGVRFESAPAHTVPNQLQPGIRIVLTLPGFPAYEKLRAGDIVTTLNGQPLSRRDPASDFADTIGSYPRGQSLELGVVRNGELLSLTVTPASSQALRQLIASQRPVTLTADYLQRLSDRESKLRDTAQPPRSIAAPHSAEPLTNK